MDERLKRAIAQHHGTHPDAIREDYEIPGDSLDRIELAMSIEFALCVEIGDADIESWRTYGDIARSLKAVA